MEHGEAALVHPRGRDYPSGRGKFHQAIPGTCHCSLLVLPTYARALDYIVDSMNEGLYTTP